MNASISLVFGGVVTSGIGAHHKLFVPGRLLLPSAPRDWPEVLQPGSLNVRIAEYPKGFAQHGLRNSVRELDKSAFAPAFKIERERLIGNTLHPTPRMPRGGEAQVWRSRLSIEKLQLEIDCWVLRRLGSRVDEQLEIVHRDKLRDLGLEDDLRVEVTIFGAWIEAQR